MIRRSSIFRKFPASGGKSAGFALVIVLAVLVLMVVLIVGFVSSAAVERMAAAGFQSSVSTRQLADMAVSFVQGQINMATSQGSQVAWASQPGMVRTFSNDAGGPLINAYKLYSAPDMIAKQVDLAKDLPPTDWADSSAIWTDLNAPVEIDARKHYPILDPTSLDDASSAPQGFSLGAVPGASPYQKAPMPVRWLYVLRDGTFVVPTNASGTTATVPGATAENPIVGRVAFWTDDDTCKVNVNTASEGTFWDTPRTLSKFDINELATKQPAKWEFQRYPGHPAMTSLKAVFPSLTSDQIYSLVPRIQKGGSEEGTKVANAVTPVVLDSDRLYANTQEILYRPNRVGNQGVTNSAQIEQAKFFLSARSRAPETNLFNLPRIACWPIYKMGANGDADPRRTTASDRLLAFCSSTGTIGESSFHPYIFQRENPLSSSFDINLQRNIELYSYLRYLTGEPYPGFGGNFLQKYNVDRDQILTEIFDYIRCVNLRDSSLPGWLGSGAELTGSPTYAPSGFVMPTHYTVSGGSETMGFGRCYTVSELGIGFICNSSNVTGVDADPASNTPDNRLFPTVTTPDGPKPKILDPGEKIIQAIMVPEFFSPMQGFIGINGAFGGSGGTDKKPQTKWCVTIEGLRGLAVTVDELDAGGTPIQRTHNLFPADLDDKAVQYGVVYSMWDFHSYGGNPNYRYFSLFHTAPAREVLPPQLNQVGQHFLPADTTVSWDTIHGKYEFIGNPIRIKPRTKGMTFSGGDLIVRLYGGTVVADDQLIQTLHIRLPGANIPLPTLVGYTSGNNPVTSAIPDQQIPATRKKNWWGFNLDGIFPSWAGRMAYAQFHDEGGGALFRKGDTLRSVYPYHGDFRLIAATPNVPVSAFVSASSYNDALASVAGTTFSTEFGLAGANNILLGNDNRGKLVDGVIYPVDSIPDFPPLEPAFSAAYQAAATGDFDTGLAGLSDGAYTNKTDEGDLNNQHGAGRAYFLTVMDSMRYASIGETLFSPNRQMPSPGMFGSLSTGVKRGQPWQTLLFRPQPSHPNFSTTVPDHLLLDLFWMPVVEPYAISDRFSTAGKINMNYQILPFTYIQRKTGLYAALAAEKVAAVPNTQGPNYKCGYSPWVQPVANFDSRLKVDAGKTLEQFDTKFTNGEIFKSASEICDVHIVPDGSTLGEMQNSGSGGFWGKNALTGENLREKIYTTLYPRLTTKSNTYTVHFRVQALKKLPVTAGNPADVWTEGRDAVLGEYRGSTSIERFVEANNPNIPNYAANAAALASLPSLDTFYRWRVVENRQFAP